MSARYRLQEWFNQLEELDGDASREDICFVMVQTRHLIETADDPDTYRTAAFYADWVVHTALDRSKVCFEVLRDIAAVLASNLDPTRPDITAEVSRQIGFPRLRSEMALLFRANDLPTVLFDYRENWRNFVMFLLWFLAGQPITFPEELRGAAKRIHEEMLALPRPRDILVSGLAVVTHNDVYHWMVFVTGEKDLTMLGQVEIAEGPEHFSPPPEDAGEV